MGGILGQPPRVRGVAVARCKLGLDEAGFAVGIFTFLLRPEGAGPCWGLVG